VNWLARQHGRLGLALAGLSVLLTFTVAVLGPSLVEPALPGRPGQPPWSLLAHPSPYLVVALAAAAVAAGTAGLALAMSAARSGWTLRPELLLLAGILVAVVLAFVPPFGSSDHLNYAAYGRIAATGHDPYTMTPAALARLGDPFGRVVRQFQHSGSVYGTLATAGQTLASLIGGTSVRLTVFALSVLNVVAFALTGLLLHWLARGDRARQFRAALLWTANPLLLQVLVAGEHVDSQAVLFVVAALAVFSASRLAREPVAGDAATVGRVPAGGLAASTAAPAAVAGALIGLGFAVKVTMCLAGAGIGAACVLTFLVRRRPGRPQDDRRLAEPLIAAVWLAAGFAVTAAAALAVWGISALTPGLQAGSYVSNGSPWRTVRVLLNLGLGKAGAEDAVKAAAIVFGVYLLVRLLRSVSGWRNGWPVIGRSEPPAGEDGLAGGGHVPVLNLVLWLTFAVAFAWLFSWPYVLPWYDAIGWALIAALPWSALDWLLLARTAALAFGYLTATGAVVPAGLTWLETVVRTGLTPVVLLACIVALILVTRPARPRLDAIMMR
jgi:hypothetical protein